MLKKTIADFRSPRERYQIAEDLHSRELGYYYFMFEETRMKAGKDQALIKKFDANGIPINKTYIDVKDKDYVYFPISIGQMGLAVFHTFLETKSETARDRFLKFVDWFFDNVDISPDLGARWITEVDLPQYNFRFPWQSAFSQSRGLSILLRGYQLTRDEKYAKLAEQALIPFTRAAIEGGVTVITYWGPFYEEYVVRLPTLVLNGMIFALCGVYDFVRVFPENKLARAIFDDGVETLTKILPEYDLGYWSRYNLCQASFYPDVDPATIAYQRLHVTQLKMMHKLTGYEIFEKYAGIFKEQQTLSNIIKMYRVKYTALKEIGRL